MVVEAAPKSDRRRPGRMQYANSALIALLRTPVKSGSAADSERNGDDLAPAKGIVVGSLLSILFWGAIGLLAWYFF